MNRQPPVNEPAITRRAFEAWSVAIPAAFAEAFVYEGGYWHAYDAHRSVSLTSMVLHDEDGAVSADRIVAQLTPIPGSPVDILPIGLLGWAVEGKATPPARASRTLSGMLAQHGRMLIVTITSDDRDWARRTWLSIRAVPAPLPPPQRAGQEDRILIH